MVIGLAVSLALGHFAASRMRNGLYKWAGISDPPDTVKSIPNWFVGLVERTFFTLVIFAVALTVRERLLDLLTPAFVWIGLKMATHWQPSMATTATKEDKATGVPATAAMIAILTGLVSLLMAALGAFVALLIVELSR